MSTQCMGLGGENLLIWLGSIVVRRVAPTCPLAHLALTMGLNPHVLPFFFIVFSWEEYIYQYFNKVKRVRHEPIVFLDRLGIKLLISHKRIKLTLITITPIISYIYIYKLSQYVLWVPIIINNSYIKVNVLSLGKKLPLLLILSFLIREL